MTAHLSLPIADTQTQPQSERTGSLFNILIVDDNPIDRLQASWLVGLDTRCRVVNAEDRCPGA